MHNDPIRGDVGWNFINRRPVAISGQLRNCRGVREQRSGCDSQGTQCDQGAENQAFLEMWHSNQLRPKREKKNHFPFADYFQGH
jgi:hypothetical protein